MGYIYAYDKYADDLSATGLVGALMPSETRVKEVKNGEYSVTMSHPFDPAGKWRALVKGNVLSVPCRVRTTPNISETGQVVTSVEEWTVKATATKAQRKVYNKAKKGKAKSTKLQPGASVIVTEKGEERYKIKAAKVTGWVAHEALEYKVTVTLPDGVDGIETILPSESVRPQLFDIEQVQIDTDAGTITVYARHISYRAAGTIINTKTATPLTAVQALANVVAGRDFAGDNKLYTDIGDSRTSFDAEDKNEIEALLDPEQGFAARWGAELLRDDEELYFLRRAGRNRGVRIEHAKNLVGATLDLDETNVVTAIKPRGVKKDGSLLYLTDDPRSPDNYILSEYASDYPMYKCAVLDCEDCTVDKGKNGVTVDIARARMREQVAYRYDHDKVDRPAVTLRVNFEELSRSVEYAHYAGLENVYMHDEVPVVAKEYGIELIANVHTLVWDPDNERVVEVELGDLRTGVDSIYSWQVQPFPGGKVLPDTLPGSALEDGTVPVFKLDPDLQAALDKAWADIDSAQELLGDTRNWLETVEGAVRDNEGNIAALEVTAAEIRAGLTNAQGDLAAVSLRADELRTAMTNAEGDISTIKQTASETASTITNMLDDISSIRQTATSVSSTVSSLNGQVASLIQQVASGIAIKLYDAGKSTNFQVDIAYSDIYDEYAMAVKKNGYDGGYICIGANGRLCIGCYDGLNLYGNGMNVEVGRDPLVTDSEATTVSAMFDGNVRPGIGVTANLGLSGARWKTVYANNSLNTSDLRFKRDVAPLDAAWLLKHLEPIRYRLIESEEPDGKLRFGFGVQPILEAIRGTDIEDANLVDVSDPDHYSLSYTDMHALHVEGWQEHQEIISQQSTLIDSLTRRIETLERSANHAKT